MQNQQSIIVGIAGLIVGVLLTTVVAQSAVNRQNAGLMNMMGIRQTPATVVPSQTNTSMTMNGMVSGLDGKSGNAFDSVFLAEMIEHHQGAIEMAKLARDKAGHSELRAMADNIILAQQSEVNQMKQWQLDWGFASSSKSGAGMEGMPGM